MQHRKVGGAVRGGGDDLPVDDRGAGVAMPSVGSDLAEAVGPVIAATSEYRDYGVSQMDLDAVTVELDFMDPPLTVWYGID